MAQWDNDSDTLSLLLLDSQTYHDLVEDLDNNDQMEWLDELSEVSEAPLHEESSPLVIHPAETSSEGPSTSRDIIRYGRGKNMTTLLRLTNKRLPTWTPSTDEESSEATDPTCRITSRP